MEYGRFNDMIAVRIDRGEEILEQLKQVCLKENVQLATVSAIGALGEFTVGVYNVEEKKYYKNAFKGAYEIVSLAGNVTTMNGEYYAHLHLSAADGTGACVGGHLNAAVVSATCELFLRTANGAIDRFYDDVTGLNLLKFE